MTKTAAEKRLHCELSGGWFNLQPQQPTCAELKHLTATPLVHLRLTHGETKPQRQYSQDRKEYEDEKMLLHSANTGHKSAETMQD